MTSPRKVAVLLCASLTGFLAVPLATRGGTPIPLSDNEHPPYLGVYVTTPPDGIRFTADWARWLHRTVLWGHASLDPYFIQWPQVESPLWNIKPWAAWVKEDHRRVVVYSIPILPKGGTETLAEGAKGTYNAHFAKLAAALVDNGLGTGILRIGWEFNGNWYPWKVQSAEDAQNYALYWRQIVTTMRAVPGAGHLRFAWNGANVKTSYPLEDAYPGDDFVDYIGPDLYDTSWAKNTYPYPPDATPEQRRQRQKLAWDGEIYPEKPNNGFLTWTRIAALHHKPLCIPEWGLDRHEKDGIIHGGLDDPSFIENMFRVIQDPANNVGFASYWDAKDSKITPFGPPTEPSNYPESTAMLQKLFSLPPK